MIITFAVQAALALERVQAQEERQLLVVLEDRERIARDLHDVVIQRLFAAGLGLQSMSRLVGRDDLRQRLDQTVTDLDTTIRDIRTAIFELRAPAAASLHSELIDTVEACADALGFRPTLRVTGLIDRGVPDALRPEIVAVAREALSNVVRHAHAHAVEVSVDVTADAFTLRVTDDGVGIDSPKPGSGLGNMRARAEDRAGDFSLTNVDPHGTRLTWTVPIPAAATAGKRLTRLSLLTCRTTVQCGDRSALSATGSSGTLADEPRRSDDRSLASMTARDSAMNAGWDPDPLGTTWATCLQSAIAAPSLHNSQPWRFRLGAHHVDVFIDPSRRLTAIDPMGREAMISVGAAVLNLRVAILAAGRIPLTQLLPSPDEPELAARITLGASHQPDATMLALQSAIGQATDQSPSVPGHRGSRRGPRPTDGGGPRKRRRSRSRTPLAAMSCSTSSAAPRTPRPATRVHRELGNWTALDPMFGEGVPPGPSARHTTGTTSRSVTSDWPTRGAPASAWFEAAPTMVMLSTEADTAVQWLRAGTGDGARPVDRDRTRRRQHADDGTDRAARTASVAERVR